MSRNKSFAVVLSAVVAVLFAVGSASAVEFGNLFFTSGSYGIWTGEKTGDFYVDSAASTAGNCAIRIGADAADDYAGGVLIPTVSENLRDGNVYTPSASTAGGRYTVVTTVAESNPTTLGGVDVAAAYFPFTEGWIAGYSYRQDGALTGAMDSLLATGGLQMGTHFYDNTSGNSQLWIPGVDPFSHGILLGVNYSGGNMFAMTQANYDGSFSIMNHANNKGGAAFDPGPVGFVFIPYGTPGVVLGQVSGSGGIVNGSGDFTITQTAQDGVLRLSIAGYDPTQGTLIVTPVGGRSNGDLDDVTLVDAWTDDDLVTYRAVGNEYEVTIRDLTAVAGTTPPTTYSWGNTAFSFVFLPFNQAPIAPGPLRERVDHTAQVTGANIAVTEYSGGNTAGAMHSTIAQSTPRVTIVNMNRGDNSIAIDGNHARFQDGVMLATVRENYRDNFPTGGALGVGLACPFTPSSGSPDGWGWEVATQVADAANRAEMNINFAVSYFPFKQGWACGVAEQTQGATGQGVLSIETPGVDSRSSGLLFVNGFGNTDVYATAAPTGTGDGWNVNVYGVNGRLWADKNAVYNYVYMPYGQEGTKNVIMGSADAEGVLLKSQGTGFALSKETSSPYPGVYRLHIDGKTPDDGMLLLTATSGGAAAGNAFLVYERDGNDFLIHGYQGVYYDPTAPAPAEAQAMATGFNFAFVDYANLPVLGTAAVNPFGKEPVAFASWQITTQDGSNTVPLISRLGASDSSMVLWPDQVDSNRADLQIGYRGGNLMAAKGVLIAQVCENRRDNSAYKMNAEEPYVYGEISWGIAAVNPTGSGFEIASFTSNHLATTNEFDCNVAAAFFPYNGEFQTGYQPILDGIYQLRLPGTGDTRKDGVLIANAMGNDDNFTSAGPTTDGRGWIVRCRDNGQSHEGDDFGYVYLPYGTDNLTAGFIAPDGGRLSWTGDFVLEQVYELDGTTIKEGIYRLTIKGESPSTGILLLTSSEYNNSSDNILTYAPDGDSFLINGLDTKAGTEPVTQATLANTEFAFAFLKYDAPITNPKLRAPLDLSKASAGNFVMTQHGTGNNNAEVDGQTVYDPVTFKQQATERFAISNSNKGDLDLALDGVRISLRKGIVMGTARCNGYDNGDGTGTGWGVVNMNINAAALDATAYMAIGRIGGTAEFNCPVAGAFFDFAGHWAGGYANGTDGSLLIDGLGDCTVAKVATGQYTLSINGVDTRTNGLLFTIAGMNGNEMVAIDARSDGSGWDLGMYDATDGNLGTYRDGNFGFLYLPFGKFEGYEIDNLLAAQVAADGSILLKEGSFTLTHEDAGEYRLSISGQTPETGMLLLSTNDLEDNVLSYQADGSDFLIVSSDLGNGTISLLEDVSFNFAFVSFADPMQVVESVAPPQPGDANGDGKVDEADASALAANWLQSGGWEQGDFNGDGNVNDLDASILAANWLYGAGSTGVPEPGTLALVLTAGLALLAWRRRG